MYSKPRLLLKYLRYFVTAANGKGHGIHSPFVFDFITNILNDRNQYYAYRDIERLRERLLESDETVDVLDLGAGSSVTSSGSRRVKDIARYVLKPGKYARLLFRMVNYYQPATVVELGTSLGITTAYLAAANKNRQVYTLEGAPAIATLAKRNFDLLHLTNVHQVTGNFDDTLQPLLEKIRKAAFVFVDGNHRKEPTVRYFNYLLPYIGNDSILVFDDIHWSAEMEAAWEDIKKHPAVTCTIDLFFIGIVLFSTDFKVKQDFTIRF